MWPILTVAPPPAAITSRAGRRGIAPAARVSRSGKPSAAAPATPRAPVRRRNSLRSTEVSGRLSSMVLLTGSGCFSGTILPNCRAPYENPHGPRTLTTKTDRRGRGTGRTESRPPRSAAQRNRRGTLHVRGAEGPDRGREAAEHAYLAALPERPRRCRFPMVLRPGNGPLPVRRGLPPAPPHPLPPRAAGARDAEAARYVAGSRVCHGDRGDHPEAPALERSARRGVDRELL